MTYSFEEGIACLGRIFDRLLAANPKLKPSKCLFFQKETKFLVHSVSPQGTATDPEKIPPPPRTKQCRSFLGLASYYRRFCAVFGEAASPLHKLCEKGVKFNWNSQAQKAFGSLKKLLTSSPVLGYPLPQQRFILDTD